ncbi:MAG TPA: ribosome biogenesis GTPase YlqF [Trichormus sp.]|jgi:ribosome biogenesis GTPase A
MPARPSGRSSSQSRTAFQHLQEQIKYVDLVIEVLDARAPLSSRHPRSREIFSNKPRLLVITKEDLGDPHKVRSWVAYFNNESDARHSHAFALSLKTQRYKDKIFQLALEMTKDKREQLAAKGLLPRPIRICVVGMPNVGKSSLINWLIGQKKAKTGNKPGITKGAQWVRVHPQIELLDTPGIMPAFSFAAAVARRLALFNLLPEAVYDIEEIAQDGFEQMKAQYPQLVQKYIYEKAETLSLEELARRRNFLTIGGNLDLVRAANVFVSDLRNGKLGRVTLDQSDSSL